MRDHQQHLAASAATIRLNNAIDRDNARAAGNVLAEMHPYRGQASPHNGQPITLAHHIRAVHIKGRPGQQERRGHSASRNRKNYQAIKISRHHRHPKAFQWNHRTAKPPAKATFLCALIQKKAGAAS